jgi:hypothetical protein
MIFARMQLPQRTPPYGRSGRFAVFGVCFASTRLIRGIPGSGLPHSAQWACLGSRSSNLSAVLPPGTLTCFLANLPLLNIPCTIFVAPLLSVGRWNDELFIKMIGKEPALFSIK